MTDGATTQQANTRERILEAALECAAEGGISSVTNRSLAARAGVSLGTLTYHFPAQEEVVREALTRFVEGEADRLEALGAQVESGGDPAAAITAVEKLLSGESGRRLAKLELYVTSARDERLREATRRCFAAYDATVERGLEALGVEPTETLIRSLVALIDGLQLRRLALGDTGELSIAEAVGLLLAGAAR